MLSRLTYSHLYHGIFILPVAVTINGFLPFFSFLRSASFSPMFTQVTLTVFLTTPLWILDNLVSAETVQVPSSSGSFNSSDGG